MEADRKPITEEAAEWLLRFEEEPDARHNAEFAAWLKRSPQHIDEFLMVEASYRTMQHHLPRNRAAFAPLMQEISADVVPLDRGMTSPARLIPRAARGHSNGTNGRRRLLAAGVAAVAGVLAIAVYLSTPQQYSTAVGEQRAFKLPDGSLLNLNTQSRVEIDFSQNARDVRLVRGEALFTVQHDTTRPFRVSTDTVLVQAVGTAFNVYRHADDSTSVAVIEGKVNIIPKVTDGAAASVEVAPLPLAAGEEISISKSGHAVRPEAPDVSQVISWQQRRLVFRGTALGEVTAQFNRYNTDVQLRVSGSDLAHRQITGTFDADNPRAFVKFLAQDPSIQLEERSGRIDIRPQARP